MNFMYKKPELAIDPILSKWDHKEVLTEEKIKEKEKKLLEFNEKILKIETANQFTSPIQPVEHEQRIEEEEEEEEDDDLTPDSPDIDPY